MIVGSVGSGKSTSCKALLGKIPFSDGQILMKYSTNRVGYCDQSAFLSNRSIRDIIIGFSSFNAERYRGVITATALTFDFSVLKHGDATNIGSEGITLSGGQKQRIALACALYLHADLLILDDVFSEPNADTEEQVFRKVFGPHSTLR